MSALSRLRWLEAQLERDDLTDLQFDSYNKEANAIQADLNAQKAKADAIRAEQKRLDQEEAEMERISAITEEYVDKMYEDACLKHQDVNGVSFREWYQQSLRYYTIDKNFVVHSCARSPKEENIDSVPCHTLANAKLRILNLIKVKFNDHAVRGYDFRWHKEPDSDTKLNHEK